MRNINNMQLFYITFLNSCTTNPPCIMQSQHRASRTPISRAENRFVVADINVLAAILFEPCLEWHESCKMLPFISIRSVQNVHWHFLSVLLESTQTVYCFFSFLLLLSQLEIRKLQKYNLIIIFITRGGSTIDNSTTHCLVMRTHHL